MIASTSTRRHAGARAQERRVIRRYTDRERHEANNLESARIIAADPVKYAGALQQWAAMVLAKASVNRLTDREAA